MPCQGVGAVDTHVLVVSGLSLRVYHCGTSTMVHQWYTKKTYQQVPGTHDMYTTAAVLQFYY